MRQVLAGTGYGLQFDETGNSHMQDDYLLSWELGTWKRCGPVITYMISGTSGAFRTRGRGVRGVVRSGNSADHS